MHVACDDWVSCTVSHHCQRCALAESLDPFQRQPWRQRQLEQTPSVHCTAEPALTAMVYPIFHLKELDVHLYQGSGLWRPRGARGVFGGQVIGQALVAGGWLGDPTWVVICGGV